LVDETGGITVPWGQWVQRTHNNAKTLQQSGVTADRPTSVLWIGRFYFDTTLNKPIWIKQVKPAVVWIDASGAVV
jgi:hypothetical protein